MGVRSGDPEGHWSGLKASHGTQFFQAVTDHVGEQASCNRIGLKPLFAKGSDGFQPCGGCGGQPFTQIFGQSTYLAVHGGKRMDVSFMLSTETFDNGQCMGKAIDPSREGRKHGGDRVRIGQEMNHSRALTGAD